MTEPTVFATLTEHILAQSGLDDRTQRLLVEKAGLSTALNGDPELRVPASAHEFIWRALTDEREDPAGLQMARRLEVGDMGIVGHIVRTSRTVGDGVRNAIRYARLLNERASAAIEVRPDGLLLEHTPQATSGAARHYTEWLLGIYVTLIRRFTGQHVSPDEVSFAHTAPAERAFYESFFGCHVRWSASRSTLLLSKSKLELPLLGADRALNIFLRRRADTLMEALPHRSDLLQQVEGIVQASLAEGAPTVQGVARRLGLSSRTLQRRLSAEGSTYAQILDRYRMQSALRLLDDERLAIGDISTMLGFSEPKAFRRAFKRWTGKSPRTHRTHRRAVLATH